MKWFQEIDNLNELRKLYRKLVVKYHPDNGGSEGTIKEINAEYDWQKDKQIREMVMQLSRFRDNTVEIIGVWIWVSNCYEYRKELKELGFHWAKQKQMWYLHFDDFHKFSAKPASMSYIREKYGSVEIRFRTEKEEKETNRRIKAL